MRPAGDVRRALLQAAADLATPAQAPTLRELAAHACVGLSAARHMVPNLVRHGALRIVRTRRVAYRARPVAEYAPAQAGGAPAQTGVDWSALQGAFARAVDVMEG